MDDAVLSAGSYIINLVKEKKPVCIITVFTEFGTRPISWDAQKYLLKSGCLGVTGFTDTRKREDTSAMAKLTIPFIHLDFIDGGFRKNEKGKPLYPTFDHLCSGNIAKNDEILLKKIRKEIVSYCKKSDIIYAPLGIGTHADHIIINRIAQTLPNKTYYYPDQPYAWKITQTPHSRNWDFFNSGNVNREFREVFRIPHHKEKKEILSCYRSQMRQLYPHGIPVIDEVFLKRNQSVDNFR
ncbi:MAG: hypothetical protein UV63_C0012G0002 [Microgenomates group bacterium GW2011_GWC1_43_11]|nr:MAG: hypothetical protein UV63_C0012G0002 [Microgenomates group bacterium GW2011_GWC1_43_11]KKT61005.1 MAG: hypothetical protein UW52_C0013G0007 [Candidatus Gottesmanbacteria bacterium GW2011_GWA1_44_24b]